VDLLEVDLLGELLLLLLLRRHRHHLLLLGVIKTLYRLVSEQLEPDIQIGFFDL